MDGVRVRVGVRVEVMVGVGVYVSVCAKVIGSNATTTTTTTATTTTTTATTSTTTPTTDPYVGPPASTVLPSPFISPSRVVRLRGGRAQPETLIPNRLSRRDHPSARVCIHLEAFTPR